MLKPILFGEKIKVEGPRASSAAGKLVDEAEARGEKAEMIYPQVAGGDTIVLTQKQGETDIDDFEAVVDKAQARYGEIMIERGMDPKVIAVITDPDSEEEIPEEVMPVLKEISAQVMAESSADLLAFFKGARVVNAADILPAEEDQSGKKVIDVTEATFEAEVEKSTVPVLVDFWAPWCAPCRQMGATVEELADEYGGKVKVVKLNIDENEAIADRYGIMSIPAFVVFQNGQPGKTIIGGCPKDSLKKEVDTQLAKK